MSSFVSMKSMEAKDLAFEKAEGIGHPTVVPALAKEKPVDFPVKDPPHDVLADPISPVDMELGVEVVARATSRHLNN